MKKVLKSFLSDSKFSKFANPYDFQTQRNLKRRSFLVISLSTMYHEDTKMRHKIWRNLPNMLSEISKHFDIYSHYSKDSVIPYLPNMKCLRVENVDLLLHKSARIGFSGCWFACLVWRCNAEKNYSKSININLISSSSIYFPPLQSVHIYKVQ